jgi:hypothetical protein
MAENKAFTERCIRQVETGVVRKQPTFGAALIDYLCAVGRLAVREHDNGNRFWTIRHADDVWRISFGLLPDADKA